MKKNSKHASKETVNSKLFGFTSAPQKFMVQKFFLPLAAPRFTIGTVQCPHITSAAVGGDGNC